MFLSHLVHLNDFSPLWVLWWILKTDVEKLLSHLVHWNGFSPVWVLSCFFSSNLILWGSGHTLCTWRAFHLCEFTEFSPVFSSNLMQKSSYQTVHLYGSYYDSFSDLTKKALVTFGAPKWFLSPASLRWILKTDVETLQSHLFRQRQSPLLYITVQ